MAIRGKQTLIKTVIGSKTVQGRMAREADKLKNIKNANESSDR